MRIQEYHKVYDNIKSQILGGYYAAGQKLAPERQLCGHYRISRVTARHALRLLEEDGLIERFQGKGTFIKSIKPTKLPITELGFAKSVKQYAPRLYRNLQKHKTIYPSADISNLLGLHQESCLLVIRTDVLNEEILGFDRAYIRLEYTESITDELLRRVDFFEKWTENENLKITFYHESIEATEANNEIASILKIKKSQAVLKSTEVYYNFKNIPVAVFESYYRGDKIKLTSTANFKGKVNVKVTL